MRKILLVSMLHTIFIFTSKAQAPVITVTDQQAPNSCTDYAKLKKDIDDLVKKINTEYAKDPAFIAKFKKAQTAWEAYRDAQLEMIFPESDKKEYGSFYPNCRCNWLIEMTYQRFDFLLKWISNFDDGDMCGGSINSKKRKSYVKLN